MVLPAIQLNFVEAASGILLKETPTESLSPVGI